MVTGRVASLWRAAAPALLLAGVSLLGSPAHAGEAVEATREARYWLERMHEATAKRNFQGTFVVSAGGSVTSARIIHFFEGANQFERIEPLDGQRRQVYRHNDVVHSFWPRERLAVVETRQALREFPALLGAGSERIVEHYDVIPRGEGRVAGHDAHVLELRPRDAYRFGFRLWAERESGLLLRAEVFDERQAVLEAIAFSELMIGVKPRPELVVQAMKRFDGYEVKRPVLDAADLAREGWRFGKLPPGFQPVSSVKRSLVVHGAEAAAVSSPQVLQAIYSDGLTHVSVFIEPYDATRHVRESLMAMGATRTLARRQGDYWLTVIGDVPSGTLRAFAVGLERLR